MEPAASPAPTGNILPGIARASFAHYAICPSYTLLRRIKAQMSITLPSLSAIDATFQSSSSRRFHGERPIKAGMAMAFGMAGKAASAQGYTFDWTGETKKYMVPQISFQARWRRGFFNSLF
jgi:hypothetical protein